VFIQNAGIGRGTIASKLEQINLTTSLIAHLTFIYVSCSFFLKEMGYKVVDWIDLAQDGDRYGFHKCGEFLDCLRNC
jgi:hypothetical protein